MVLRKLGLGASFRLKRAQKLGLTDSWSLAKGHNISLVEKKSRFTQKRPVKKTQSFLDKQNESRGELEKGRIQWL